MPIPTMNDIRPVLADFELRFRSVLEGAWAGWDALPAWFRAQTSRRSRASIIYDSIKRLALIEFKGDPDVRPIEKGQTLQLLVRDSVVLRFKKANSLGLGSNIETQAVIAFIDPQLTIPDLLMDIFKVEVCYHLNKIETGMALLAVTARDRHRKIFSYELKHPRSAELHRLPDPPDSGLKPPEVHVRVSKDKPETSE